MAHGRVDGKVEKSYLSSAVDSINPWASTSRSSTPTSKDSGPKPASSGDHSITHLYGQSTKSYPAGCPTLHVLWFHAVDIPRRKPRYLNTASPDDAKPTSQPKKFVAFSVTDSRNIETAYQQLLEDSERVKKRRPCRTSTPKELHSGDAPNTSLPNDEGLDSQVSTRVPVNEDYLFDVDIEQRELAPVYWLGPVYEVRRGTWFYQEGSNLKPCDENLASQLEEGYLKVKPWLSPLSATVGSSTGRDASSKTPETPETPEVLQGNSASSTAGDPVKSSTSHQQPKSHRLFGTYMNSFVTYQDANTAWLSSDSVLSRVTSTVYERFAGGGYMSGVKLTRGWTDLSKGGDTKASDGNSKAMDAKPTSGSTNSTIGFSDDEGQQRSKLKRRSAPPSTATNKADRSFDDGRRHNESRETHLQRQLSSFMAGSDKMDPEEEEALRNQAEQEIQADYEDQSGETQGREIEHLVLVTHGVGQLLGMRMDSMNFVHDVNLMRKSMKSTYAESADLRALNSESSDGPMNCRVQVLPVCWRHLLQFPQKKERKAERDLGDLGGEEDDYPSLEDITIEGVTFARSLISDLALDVLLYQSAYREQISDIVLKESNRIFDLFMERNPDFQGKVHIVGHSLGSAIMFDILCRQREDVQHHDQKGRKESLRFWPSREPAGTSKEANELRFNFEVEDFYCLGSPIGLFQMLKGRTISARHLSNAAPSESPFSLGLEEDPFTSTASATIRQRVSPITGLPFSISSPKVAQLFNIFHPSDPISYRLEPLVSPAMSSLKPQVLPYTKRGLFGNVAQQGLSGISMKVGQSVSGFWSSISAGIAGNILNRSLGLNSDGVAKMNSPPVQESALGAGNSLAEARALSDASRLGEETDRRKKQLADSVVGTEGRTSLSGNDLTLIDDELQTLFSIFQEKRAALANTSNEEDPVQSAAAGEDRDEEEREARKLRLEDRKVKALNRNGRVDYSIQESVMDFNPINTIASHMGYWTDEDVIHFMLSQLLASRARDRRRQSHV